MRIIKSYLIEGYIPLNQESIDFNLAIMQVIEKDKL